MLNNAFVFFASSRPLMWYWEQCDTAAKIVVGILGICSIWSFSTILQKFVDLRALRKENLAFEAQLHREEKLTEIGTLPSAGTVSPYAQVLDSALRALRQHRGKITGESDVRVCMGHVENSVQRAIGRVTARYEKGMIPLSTFISGGPFLGLLGTVWGVMVTFGALTEKASIAELAPGVSGALVATTAGLLLAIPASFAYNWVLGQTRQLGTELDNFASAVADQIEIELLEELREQQKNSESVPASAGVTGSNPFLREDTENDFAPEKGTLPRSRPSWE
ncbi:MAG: MotA/TolQ/ExbB proton channel family protein [Opitutales bacterium]|nr:MotA/TolQ/ExbB proton channel family protein [Opitutales bacterium]